MYVQTCTQPKNHKPPMPLDSKGGSGGYVEKYSVLR